MGTYDKLLNTILSGISDNNINFLKLKNLLLKLGFNVRVKGDHFIFFKDEIAEIINIQPTKNNKAKSYQIKQIRNLILKYKLTLSI